MMGKYGWNKADGAKAIALFNLADTDKEMKVNLKALGITGKLTLRDVYKQKNIAQMNAGDSYSKNVYSHGVVLIKVAA